MNTTDDVPEITIVVFPDKPKILFNLTCIREGYDMEVNDTNTKWESCDTKCIKGHDTVSDKSGLQLGDEVILSISQDTNVAEWTKKIMVTKEDAGEKVEFLLSI